MTRVLNLKIISKVISINLFVVASALAVCIGIALIYSENITPFTISSIIAISFGFIFLLMSRGLDKNKYLQRKDAYFTVTLSWIILGLVGTLPYILSNAIPSFTNALFESVSGFTTTGASILTDIESLPKSILFWRSLTHWIGGIGIIMVIIIILPSLQIGGYNLFTLESSLQNKLKPKIKDVGKRLLIIYVALTAVETVFLLAGNMNLFDSICHSFGTVATGGFSPKNSSIANYSPYIQYVIMIFMLLAGTNFAIHYYLLKRDFNKIKENEEFRFYLLIIIIIGGIITAALFFKMNKPFEEAFREAFFQVISIITCTGFASSDYLLWPTFAWVLILFAMFLGGSTGSTAGGIKMVRHLIFIKNLKNYFRKILHPNAIIPIKLNNHNLPIEINKSALTFITTYFLIFIIGSLLLVSIGIDGETASSSVATCMAGIGPGIGKVGPASNFAFLPNLAKILLSILMIIGRLEINTVVILFTRNFWKK